MEPLKLKLNLKSVPVLMDTGDGEREWTLKELTGEQRNVFLDEMKDRTIIGADGKPSGFKSFEGLQSGLLALCLYDENGKLIKKDVLEKMPSSAQQALFDSAQKLSGMDKAGAQEKS